ncbi:MAG TPA: DUF5667 domain-containing protein [Pedococcus sp.]|jgi:hypothetical protein|uniref:DUF5667 domain-containing protein n=1 Tax=Pedococcus sp. TaxID=2860345 RepID=UPI002F947D61
MALSHRAAERFQRALDGDREAGAGLEGLLETARSLASVSTPGLAPREEFVAALRDRLVAEAEAMPTPSPAAAHTAASRRAAARTGPVVVVFGRGLPRVIAGAAASVLAVGAVVGVASRSAIPGSALYPVKGWLDAVAVQMAGSDYERGLTHLSQAQEHISDTRNLAGAGSTDVSDYEAAIEAATSSVRAGQRDLNTAFDATGNPQALIAVRDFSARAIPQVEALRGEVPAAALPELRELQALLTAAENTSLRRLAACSPSCLPAVPSGAGPSTLPSLATTGVPTGGSSTASTTQPGVSVPSTAVTVPPGGGGLPGATAGPGGATLGGGGGGATLGTGGATLNGPTVTGPGVPGLPTVTATLPSVTLSTGGAGATLPGGGVGTLTLPGVGVTVTLPTLP